MAPREKLMDRIRKLLALAGNNPNREEAQLALCKAQEMLVAQGLGLRDLDQEEESPSAQWFGEVGASCPPWLGALCCLIAENFRCEAITFARGRKRRLRICGLPQDLEVALYVMHAAEGVAEREWQIFKKSNELARGKARKNSFMLGFRDGLREAFALNVERHSFLPSLIVPAVVVAMPEVRDAQVRNSSIRTRGKEEGLAGHAAGAQFRSRGQLGS